MIQLITLVIVFLLAKLLTSRMVFVHENDPYYLRDPKTGGIELVNKIGTVVTYWGLPPAILVRRFFIPFKGWVPKREAKKDVKDIPKDYYLDTKVLGTIPALLGSVLFFLNYLFYKEYLRLLVVVMAWLGLAYLLPDGHWIFTLYGILLILDAFRTHLTKTSGIYNKLIKFHASIEEVENEVPDFNRVVALKSALVKIGVTDRFTFSWFKRTFRVKVVAPLLRKFHRADQ